MPAEFMDEHSGHGSSYLAAGLAFAGIGFAGDHIRGLIDNRGGIAKAWRHKSILLSVMLHVASASGRIRVSEIERLFWEATKTRVGENDVRRVYADLSRPDAPTLGQLLSCISSYEDKGYVLRCVASVWAAIGVDSKEATHVVETITASLGLSEDDVCQLLDGPSPCELDTGWRARSSALLDLRPARACYGA